MTCSTNANIIYQIKSMNTRDFSFPKAKTADQLLLQIKFVNSFLCGKFNVKCL